MKKIIILILVLTCLACSGKVKMGTKAETGLGSRAQIVSCDEKLKALILSCSNFKTPFSKKDMHAEIVEEDENGVYKIRLFEYGTGVEATSTQGWLELNVNDKSLKDVTTDPMKPVILKYNPQQFKEYVEGCLGKKPNQQTPQEAFNLFYEKLPHHSLPLAYSYDFVLDLPGTQELNGKLYSFFESIQDDIIDLSNSRIAKILSLDTNRLFVLFAHDKRGENYFLLVSMNKENKLIDKLPIYCSKDIKWKNNVENCYLDYKITKQYRITLRETIALADSDVVIKERVFKIKGGKFIQEYCK